MADLIHQGGLKALKEGLLHPTPDVRLKLVMTDTTADTAEDAIYLVDVTLDEFDGIGYQEIDCANVTFTYDATANEYQLKFDDDEFNVALGTVAPGTRDAAGVVLYLYVDGTPANDILIGFSDQGGFPFNAANGAILYTAPTNGLIYLQQAP